MSDDMLAKAEAIGQKSPDEQETELYRSYLHNVRQAEMLKDEILLGMKAGDSLASLLLKATTAISRMTDDRNYADQCELYLKSVYGEGIGDEGALALKEQEVRDRLARLEKAERETDEIDVKNAIRLSIKAHQARLDRLTAKEAKK